jgi:hypothetical protein
MHNGEQAVSRFRARLEKRALVPSLSIPSL